MAAGEPGLSRSATPSRGHPQKREPYFDVDRLDHDLGTIRDWAVPRSGDEPCPVHPNDTADPPPLRQLPPAGESLDAAPHASPPEPLTVRGQGAHSLPQERRPASAQPSRPDAHLRAHAAPQPSCRSTVRRASIPSRAWSSPCRCRWASSAARKSWNWNSTKPLPPEDVHARLARQTPPGLDILSVRRIDPQDQRPGRRLSYRAARAGGAPAGPGRRIAEVLAARECWIERHRPHRASRTPARCAIRSSLSLRIVDRGSCDRGPCKPEPSRSATRDPLPSGPDPGNGSAASDAVRDGPPRRSAGPPGT